MIVSTAQEARDILRREAPDGILAESEGQEVSGKDLSAIVKTCPRLQHIPVILLTASALPSDYASSHEIAAVVSMTIPGKPERLRSAIHLVAAPPALCSVYSALQRSLLRAHLLNAFHQAFARSGQFSGLPQKKEPRLFRDEVHKNSFLAKVTLSRSRFFTLGQSRDRPRFRPQ